MLLLVRFIAILVYVRRHLLTLSAISVLAVVSAEITKPFGDRGSEGMLQFATSFSGMAELGVDNSSRCGEMHQPSIMQPVLF